MSEIAADDAVQRQIDAYRRRIDDALADVAKALPADDEVSRAARYAIGTGGKRLRPVLCLAGIEALRGAPAEHAHVRAAAAVELIHTDSLVHDDLPCMDDDDLRRGRPTVHRAFSSRAAIAAGFALIPLACRLVADACAELRLDNDVTASAVRELCAGAGAAGMVGGQVRDLEAEGRTLDIEALTRVHDMKTGALFGAALRLAAILAGAEDARREALGRYGRRLGLAFQIRDDVLDITMDAATLGKTAGKDAGAAKATFPALMGLAAADAAARAEADGAAGALAEAGVDSLLLTELARFAAVRSR